MTNTPTLGQFEKIVYEAMQKEVRRAVEAVYDDERVRLNKRLDDEKEKMLAAISLHFMKQIDVNRFGEHITITLRSENIK